LQKSIGEGSYGIVYKAIYRDQEVAFKTVKNLNQKQLDDFKREAALMVTLKPHTNVLKCFGVCLEPNEPIGIITEFLWGSLKDLLKQFQGKFSFPEIAGLASDVAKGMRHLQIENVVHRDLSARNILVAEGKNKWTCKVADFGLSRIIEAPDASGKTVSDVGPIRWMAPESLLYKTYSVKSDVWSFGVTMVEILDNGRDPYPDLDPVQAASNVMYNNLRPTIPETCPPKLEEMLKQCFSRSPEERPDFKHILTVLDEISQEVESNPFY